jgi:hypothetical protein
MKSLNLGASFAPRMEQAASQIQASSGFPDFSNMALPRVRLSEPNKYTAEVLGRALAKSKVALSGARRSPAAAKTISAPREGANVSLVPSEFFDLFVGQTVNVPLREVTPSFFAFASADLN